MADLERLNDLREAVEESNDPEIVRQRDLLQQGVEQPVFEAMLSTPILEDVVEVEVGQTIEIPFDLPSDFIDEVVATESRAFIVIRLRSMTDNTFSVLFQLGPEGGIPQPQEASRENFLLSIPFFDHADAEDHALGELLESDSPLGHFFIDATAVLNVIREQGAEGPVMALQVTPTPVHQEVDSEIGFFALGAITLDVVPDVS